MINIDDRGRVALVIGAVAVAALALLGSVGADDAADLQRAEELTRAEDAEEAAELRDAVADAEPTASDGTLGEPTADVEEAVADEPTVEVEDEGELDDAQTEPTDDDEASLTSQQLDEAAATDTESGG